MNEFFDANQRLAEVALWADGTARWLDHAVGPLSPAGGAHAGMVNVTFSRKDLELLLSGMRGVARTLMGIAQPTPPPLPAPLPSRGYLRVVR
jgi:hypothetical protein